MAMTDDPRRPPSPIKARVAATMEKTKKLPSDVAKKLFRGRSGGSTVSAPGGSGPRLRSLSPLVYLRNRREQSDGGVQVGEAVQNPSNFFFLDTPPTTTTSVVPFSNDNVDINDVPTEPTPEAEADGLPRIRMYWNANSPLTDDSIECVVVGDDDDVDEVYDVDIFTDLPTTPDAQKIKDPCSSNSPQSTVTASTCATSSSLSTTSRLSPGVPHPEEWPHRPLMLCATVGTGTRVLGTRRVCDPPESSSSWEVPSGGLPINHGREGPGEAWVTDFESEAFRGTLLLRLRDDNDDNDQIGYFASKQRTYQAVVRGHFLPDAPLMRDCITGQRFRYPTATPPRMVRHAALKIISFFAPRLEADFDRGWFLSPLATTAQTIWVNRNTLDRDQEQKQAKNQDQRIHEATTIDGALEEPTSESGASLLCHLAKEGPGLSPDLQPSGSPVSLTRARHRKKMLDRRLFEKDRRRTHSDTGTHTDVVHPRFNDADEYTFEFLQHLVDFPKYQAHFGPLGKVGLSDLLQGQPLVIMAAVDCTDHDSPDNKNNDRQLRYLWSFDIWHESLYEDALRLDGCQ